MPGDERARGPGLGAVAYSPPGGGLLTGAVAQRRLDQELKRYPVRVSVQAELAGGSVSHLGGPDGAGEGSVTGSQLELVAGWVIDWLYGYSKINRSSIPAIPRVMTELG